MPHLGSAIKLAPVLAEPLEEGVVQLSVVLAVEDGESLQKDGLEDVENDKEQDEEEGEKVQGGHKNLSAVGEVWSAIGGLHCSVPHELVPIFSSQNADPKVQGGVVCTKVSVAVHKAMSSQRKTHRGTGR